MSNHLYKYITNITLDYLNDSGVPEGERFNLFLENKDQVSELYSELNNNSTFVRSEFKYKHQEGDYVYKTFKINIQGTELIIASSQNATEDFFTTLRNEVSSQKEQFKGTAILILFSGKLDSLLGGSGSLIKEGMPLHHNIFKETIRKDIFKSTTLSDSEKEILNIIIDKKTKSVIEDNNSIFDYASIIECLDKGTIGEKGYKELGLFPHSALGDFSSKAVRSKMINRNIEKFEEFEEMHLHGNPQKDLDNKVIDAGKKALSQTNWHHNDFGKVVNWMDIKSKQTPSEIISISESDVFQAYWPKESSGSKAGKRTQSVLVFNPTNHYPYSIEAEFDISLGNHIFKCKGEEITANYGAKKLRIEISGPSSPDDQLRYVDLTDKRTNKKYSFNIIEVPWSENTLSNFKTRFSVDRKKGLLLLEESDSMIFNPGFEEEQLNIEENKIYNLIEDQSVHLKVDYESLENDDLVPFQLCKDKFYLKVGIKPQIEIPHIITGLDVWKEKRQYRTNFEYSLNEDIFKVSFKHNDHNVRGEFRKNLLLEKKMIESSFISWNESTDLKLSENSISINSNIEQSFRKLIEYYRSNNTLPSLAHLSDELRELSQSLIQEYMKELMSINENSPLTISQRDLLSLGVVKEQFDEGLIKYSPLHPINLAYQFEIEGQLKQEGVYNAILKKLNANNLVPYILGEKAKTYTIIESDESPEWIYYTEYIESEQSTPKHFVSKVIKNKIDSFTKNFEFLFSQSIHSPIKLNVVNMGDCKEVVQGIFEYYRTFVNAKDGRRLSDLLPLDVNIYGSEKLVTKFEEITYYNNVDELEKDLKIKLDTNKNYTKEDLLNIFLEKVNFYTKTRPKTNESYDYAHVTFYQFDNTKRETQHQKTSLVNTGISLGGLISDVSTMQVGNSYRSGFGIKNLPEEQNQLTKLACLQNSFANVAPGNGDYELDKSLCKSINLSIKSELENLYHNSQWVTFLDPKVDLDFFKNHDNLVIVHYSDQYTTSGGFDAITVSNKSKQYEDIVSGFLTKQKVSSENTEKDVRSVIDFFNAINGDWLLKLIRRDDQFPREKISLLSGIKSSLALLHQPKIIWVPISLEEILRVSGNVGLKSTEGLFSTKNLNPSDRSFSDDLLLIGLQRINDKLEMYLYPVELKIGGKGLAKKGVGQGRRTSELLYKYLNKDNFKAEFYRNFFAKLAIVSAEKLNLYGIWKNQNWDLIINDYRGDLINNNFVLSERMWKPLGKFGLIHFEINHLAINLRKEEDYLHAEFPESEGYNYLLRSIDSLIDLFHNKPTGIDQKLLLKNQNYLDGSSDKTNDKNDKVKDTTHKKLSSEIKPVEKASQKPIRVDRKTELTKVKTTKNGEGIEVLFGTNLKDGKDVIWEPNNTDKVMHTNTGIIGTMGTGKTQFTKSLISQLIWNEDKNIDNEDFGILIFDYKGDYIKDDFVNATGAKVFEPYHLPYNPLALDATEKSKPMLPLHTANDLKETISNAFNLGNVQKQKLRDVIVEAYEDRGIYKSKRNTWTQSPPTMGDVCNIYMSDEKVAQDSLYSAMSNLQDFEIFEPDTSKTQSLYSLIDGITVINLSGYDESIQNLIVAITLDAFYTQMQTHGHSSIHGGKRQLKKMILVDEADNFLGKNFNSIKKILKEGREFGVGTILSTQFLNHFSTGENEYSNYILTWVIHRVNEIKSKEIESLFSINSKDQRDNLMKTIKGLDKHQSIVNLAGSEPLLIKDKAFWELIK